jgi:hypothetical protein
MSFCFFSTNPHLVELPKIGIVDNPVYLFSPKTFIPILSLDDTQDMIRRLGYFMGLDFDRTVIAHIHQRFGGHPFFIRQFCSQIHKKLPLTRPRSVSLNLCNSLEQDVGSDLRGYFNEILSTLKLFYPDEYDMLQYLAREERGIFDEMAREFPAFVEHLVGYGIVTRRGDDFDFAFDAVSRAVQENLPLVGQTDLEAKRSEISRRRNRVEEEIRTSLYRWARKISAGEWSSALTRVLSDSRRRSIGNITINQAFSRRGSPLNFIELLSFLQNADELLAGEATLSEVGKAMQVVNTSRIDAHAKNITDTQYIELVGALELLETIFLPPE